jgi:hypothetical protein
VSLKVLFARTNGLVVNRQSYSKSDSDSDSELLSQLGVGVVRSEKLVAEAGDSSETQRDGNVRC